jgi:hypothetical protein
MAIFHLETNVQTKSFIPCNSANSFAMNCNFNPLSVMAAAMCVKIFFPTQTSITTLYEYETATLTSLWNRMFARVMRCVSARDSLFNQPISYSPHCSESYGFLSLDWLLVRSAANHTEMRAEWSFIKAVTTWTSCVCCMRKNPPLFRKLYVFICFYI